jgi:hypothetical protein
MIRRSQKRLIGFIAKTDEPLNVTAKRLDVSRKQLETFLFQPVKATRRSYNRSSARKIFEQTGAVKQYKKVVGGVVETRILEGKERHVRIGGTEVTVSKFSLTGPIAGVKRIPRIRVKPYVEKETGEVRERVYIKGVSKEAQRRASILAHSSALEYRTTEAQASIQWQVYASEKGIPTSIMDIKSMYQEGQLSSRQVASILTHWHQVYSDGMSDDYYENTLEDFDLDYDED